MKRSDLPLLILLLTSILLSLKPTSPVYAVSTPFIRVTIGHSYYLRGENVEINVFTNTSQSYNLKIYDPLNTLLANLNRTTDVNGNDQITPLVQQNQKSGTYTVKATLDVEPITSTAYFSVLETTNYSATSFPYYKQHESVNYTIRAKGFYASILEGNMSRSINIIYPTLPVSFTVTVFENNMSLVERLRNNALGISIDLSYLFIHNGMKILINGSVPQPTSYTFSFDPNPQQLKRKLDQLRNGFLVFDWSDIRKAGQAFTYNSTTRHLTVSIPSNFRIDPYIFSSGFESGDLADFDGTTTTAGETVEVTNAGYEHHGAYKLNATTNGTAGDEYAYVYKTVSNLSVVHVKAAVWFESGLPLTDDGDRFHILGTLDGGVGQVWATIQKDTGTDYFGLRIQTTTYYTSITPETGRWYVVELVFDATNDYQLLYIDGNLEINQSWATSAEIDQVRFGIAYASGVQNSLEVWVDCVVIDDSYIGFEHPLPWSDGFESGDTSAWDGSNAWSGGSVSVVSTIAKFGTYSLKTYIDGSNVWGVARVYLALDVYHTLLYAKTFIYFNSSEIDFSGNNRTGYIITFRNSTAYFMGGLRVSNETGAMHLQLMYRKETGTMQTAYNDTWWTGYDKWYGFEVAFNFSASNGFAKAWVNNELKINKTSLATKQTYSKGARVVYFGDDGSYGGNAWEHTLYHDNCSISTSYMGTQNYARYSLNLRTIDKSSNTLQNTTINMNNGTQYSTATTNGWANYTGIQDGTTVQVNASWIYSDFYVNNTFSISVTSNTTLNVVCRAYNFTYNGRKRWVASDRNFNSATWNSTGLYWDLNFSNPSKEPHWLVFDSGRRPSYLLNVTYDQSSSGDNWNATNGVFKGRIYNETSTVRISFADWGDTYIYRIGRYNQVETRAKFLSVSLSNQNMTFQIYNYSDTGTADDWVYYRVVVYCGGRGQPAHHGGFTSTSYNTETTLWTAYFNQSGSSFTAFVDWVTGRYNPGASGQIKPGVKLWIYPASLGELTQDTDKQFRVHLNWTGVNEITLMKVEFPASYSNWISETALPPITFTRDIGQTYGQADIILRIKVPPDTMVGDYNIPLVFYFQAGATQVQAGASALLTVAKAEQLPQQAEPIAPIPNIVGIGLMATLVAIVVGSVWKNRKSPL